MMKIEEKQKVDMVMSGARLVDRVVLENLKDLKTCLVETESGSNYFFCFQQQCDAQNVRRDSLLVDIVKVKNGVSQAFQDSIIKLNFSLFNLVVGKQFRCFFWNSEDQSIQILSSSVVTRILIE